MLTPAVVAGWLMLSPSDVAQQLGVSPSGLRRLTVKYGKVHGDLPKALSNTSGQ